MMNLRLVDLGPKSWSTQLVFSVVLDHPQAGTHRSIAVSTTIMETWSLNPTNMAVTLDDSSLIYTVQF